LYLALLSSQLDLVRRRIVLHLFARLEIVSARRYYRRLADAVPPAERGQCWIG
jgi:hypothetical protein